jgi:hypothetical protein
MSMSRHRSWTRTVCSTPEDTGGSVSGAAYVLALGGTLFSMGGRPSKLEARVLRLALILFGPLLGVIGLAVLVPTLADSTARGLFMFALIWLFCSLLLTPAILFPDSGSPPGSEGGGGGGGGDDPPEPSLPPNAPRGGLPLPDADQSRQRVRDHRGRTWRRAFPRRLAQVPHRGPTVPHK